MENIYSHSKEQVTQDQRQFILQVYNWMGSGLLITGIVAFYVANSPFLINMIFSNSFIPIMLMIGTFGMVMFLASRIEKISSQTAKYLFFAYAALNGITFSTLFLQYTGSSIASTFLVTAGTFGAMSLYGYTTKKDLTSLGSFLIMGLIGIIIASIVNMVFQSAAISWITTYLGIFIFIGLTAYDTQKIKEIGLTAREGTENYKKMATIGALHLYLDFINLFVLLLHFFTGSRD